MRMIFAAAGVQMLCAGAALGAACGQVSGDADAVSDKLAELAELAEVADAPACRQSGQQVTCVWEFSLGSDAAGQTYNALVRQLHACGELPSVDVPVNHPDKSLGTNGTWGGVAVRISLKDKNAIGKTYVFVHRRAP